MDEQGNADYRAIFGRNPEPWRAPLGALRMTLTPGDPVPYRSPIDGSRYAYMEKGDMLEYDPRPEYDPPWTLARAREELEELVRVLNGVKK